jgi:cysteine desulfurase
MSECARLTTLRDTTIREIQKTIPGAILNGHLTRRLPNNIHFSFPYIEGESIVLLLDTYGICAATGSACSAQNLAPSHVLRALGQGDECIHGSLRLTLGRSTTHEDIMYTVEKLQAVVERLTSMSPLPLHL